MYIDSKTAEGQAVLEAARAMCAAARTAPKACGTDELDTAILTGEDKDALATKMREIGTALGDKGGFFIRDAGNVDESAAVVLIGAKYETRKLGKLCGLCGFDGCTECKRAGATCVFTPMDLGIALGSAVAVAADRRLDNRMMFTAGKAADALGMLGELGERRMIIGIPLSASGKSPYFDRK
ncbi:MAG: DUF2148 domain-containing protein [Oscillospiraceae bacterium]|jgi:uncharacterized ferredoxin-like protein|nr:DUF2148 domain-containing protein [Oscillospiraceae bacterium]